MGVENERITNLSHLSLESIPKSVNNENNSGDHDISIDNQIQIHRIADYAKDVNGKNGEP